MFESAWVFSGYSKARISIRIYCYALALILYTNVGFASEYCDIGIAASKHIGSPDDPISKSVVNVIVYEHKNNVGEFDYLQDEALKRTLRVQKNIEWWDKWRDFNRSIEVEFIQEPRKSNKWPASLYATGYVQSFGVGQITPRTILNYCFENKDKVCGVNTREVMVGLTNPAVSVSYVVALIREAYDYGALNCANWDKNQHQIAATIFNVGLDFYKDHFFEEDFCSTNKFGESSKEVFSDCVR